MVTVPQSKDKHYVHTQGVPALEWVIVHGLGKYPAVTVVDSGGNELHGSVRYDSINQATVINDYAFSGKAYCN